MSVSCLVRKANTCECRKANTCECGFILTIKCDIIAGTSLLPFTMFVCSIANKPIRMDHHMIRFEKHKHNNVLHDSINQFLSFFFFFLAFQFRGQKSPHKWEKEAQRGEESQHKWKVKAYKVGRVAYPETHP